MNTTPFGVIGAGRIGKMHAENLVHLVPGATVKAVASPRVDREWAEEHGIAVCTTSNEEVFGDQEIQAVVITAPSGLHAELICQAAEAGKHIFCEKPVAFEPAAISRALAAAEAAGVQLQVGFNRRFDPGLQKMSTMVQRGDIGEIQILKVTNRDPKAPPIDFVKRSGGLFFDFTIHDLDTVRFLSQSEIVEVYAVGTVLIDPDIGAAGDIDTAVISLRLASGALAVIDNSRQAVYGYDQRFEVFGSSGNVFVENTRATTLGSSSTAGVFVENTYDSFVTRYREAFVSEVADFLRCVRDGVDVSVGAGDALEAVRAAGAARQSMEERRPVRLDQATGNAAGGSTQ
jgi:myo-inositol 2-dehydrogenase/D-chiro-inositol 1-dehydrogenase